jgi:hypothetical protein
MPAPQQAPAPPEARATEQADRKTELVALDGARVDRIRLRYDIVDTWLVDTQSILYRDDSRAYYLVTLKEACKRLDIRSLRFTLYPSWSWQLRADRAYEVRPQVGSHCDVAKIEQIDRARADALREASQWRIW